MNGFIIALAVVTADGLTQADHRRALPSDIEYKPYKHARIVRWSGRRLPVRRGRTHLRDLGRFEYPGEQNPHNAVMFDAPGGGLTKIKGLRVQKWSYIPGQVRKYGRSSNINGYAVHHVYPKGTRFAETIEHSGAIFEVRCLHKDERTGKWSFDIEELGPKPHGYVAVTDCRSCHQHAGKDSFAIGTVGQQRWWGYGWAPGDDMVISFDPAQEGL